MKSHDATLNYLRPLPDGKIRLWLDLFPAIPMSSGGAHEAFVRHFGLQETGEVPGLRTLRGRPMLEEFLAFFGTTWQEAQARWPDLAWMNEYRRQHGFDAYAALDQWQTFYNLLDDGVSPSSIELAFVEHD